jgi:hypothetical protein
LAAQRFFEATPFICEQGDKLTSLVFLGDHVTLDDKKLSSYLRACLFQGEHLSTCIVLLNDEWAARTEVIRTIVRAFADSTRIIDLSKGLLSELPALIYGSADLSVKPLVSSEDSKTTHASDIQPALKN